MPKLRDQLLSLRPRVGGEDRYIIPHQALHRLMTRDVVLDAIKNCEDIPVFHQDSTVDAIMRGGRKIFSVLVLLKGEEWSITKFREHDQLQNSRLDARLPFSIDTLNLIVLEIADEFYEKQWELIGPIFSKDIVHRFLQPETRLPFIHNEKIGEGGFGVVYKVKLDPDHQKPTLLPQAVCILCRYPFNFIGYYER